MIQNDSSETHFIPRHETLLRGALPRRRLPASNKATATPAFRLGLSGVINLTYLPMHSTPNMSEGLNHHAIVFGASGLIGWSLVNQLLTPYPDAGSFSKVTAVTNRPLNLSDCHWPQPDSRQPDLQLVSGIDLRHGDATALAESLRQEIKGIESVTHIYYLGMSLFGSAPEHSLSLQSFHRGRRRH